MKIQLSDHFTYKRLIRFVLPSIVMMVFTSVYGVVDGLFVSNYAGKTPFAAVNLIMPVIMIMGTIGLMIGTGGSAIVSKTLGEGKKEKASEYFSMLVYTSIILGVLFTIAGLLLLRPIAIAIGAEGEILENCIVYGRILIIATVPFILQYMFQSFFVTAEKPTLGLIVTIAAGVTNIILDWLLVGVFNYGIEGAAAATAMSQVIGGILPLFYFASKNKSLLRLTKAKFYGKVFLKACTNGSSELMTNVSMSLVNMLYNTQLLKLEGENGVAAYGVIMYVNLIFLSIFIGYSIGSAPIFGYHYGAENHKELKELLKKSLIITGTSGVILTAAAILLASPLSKIFVGYDQELFELTCNGFKLFSISFLISGFNIFASSFFTALGNGLVSATISFSRTLLFQVAAVMLLPMILGINGIWLAIVAAEAMAIIVTSIFLITNKKKYKY